MCEHNPAHLLKSAALHKVGMCEDWWAGLQLTSHTRRQDQPSASSSAPRDPQRPEHMVGVCKQPAKEDPLEPGCEVGCKNQLRFCCYSSNKTSHESFLIFLSWALSLQSLQFMKLFLLALIPSSSKAVSPHATCTTGEDNECETGIFKESLESSKRSGQKCLAIKHQVGCN